MSTTTDDSSSLSDISFDHDGEVIPDQEEEEVHIPDVNVPFLNDEAFDHQAETDPSPEESDDTTIPYEYDDEDNEMHMDDDELSDGTLGDDESDDTQFNDMPKRMRRKPVKFKDYA